MNSERQECIKGKAGMVLHTFNGVHDREDLEAARGIASAAIDTYGDFETKEIWDQYRTRGIWNDHVAVQAALVAIKMMRAELVPALSPTRATHSLATKTP